MKYLILGVGGMLGHKLYQVLGHRNEVFGTLRQPLSAYHRFGLFSAGRVLGHIDVLEDACIEHALSEVRPDIVVNAVGVVKQHHEASDPERAITVNALLPHRLARACARHGCRLVHFSTDCVFSGRRGGYTESDEPDPVDLYGRTKLLGEVDVMHALTIRTSIIGRELQTTHGLVEWFLNQKEPQVKGFAEAVYTGFTTLEIARIVDMLCQRHSKLHGVLQVASNPINKYELLLLLKEAFGLTAEVDRDTAFHCDRSLKSERFCDFTGYQPPSWPEMVAQMRSDDTPYARWRAQHGIAST